MSLLFAFIWGAIVSISLVSLEVKRVLLLTCWQYWVLLVIPIVIVTWLDK